MSVKCEQIAAEALRDWLLMQLPAKVAEVNALRSATLKASYAGPYTIASGGILRINDTAGSTSYTTCVLTSGSRTAAQVASDINGTLAGRASADTDGRLVLTSSTAPTSGDSVMAVSPLATNDANAVFGWDKGGEKVTVAPLGYPTRKGIMDGWPLAFDAGPASGKIFAIIGERSSVPVQPVTRRDEYVVDLEMLVMRAEPHANVHGTREGIHSAVRCVREILQTIAGRQLGRATTGDIVLVSEKGCRVADKPFSFFGTASPNPLYDVALMKLQVRVFERPAST